MAPTKRTRRTPTPEPDPEAAPPAAAAASGAQAAAGGAPPSTAGRGKREAVQKRPPPDEIADETRVAALLPPDRPWAPTARRVAERRIGGFATSERLLHRRARRPAGNSRRFWAAVEDDDPFLPRASGGRLPQGEDFFAGEAPLHEPAAVDRLGRTEGSRPEPRPRAEPAPRPAPERPPSSQLRTPSPVDPEERRAARPAPVPRDPGEAAEGPEDWAPEAAPEPTEPRLADIPRKVQRPTVNPDPRRAPPPPRPPPAPAGRPSAPARDLEASIPAAPPPRPPPTPSGGPAAAPPRPPPVRPPAPAPVAEPAAAAAGPLRPPPPRPPPVPGGVAGGGRPPVRPPAPAAPRGTISYDGVPAGDGVRKLVDSSGRSSAEIRKEKEDARRGPRFPPKKTLDEYAGILSDLATQAAAHAARMEEEEALKKQKASSGVRTPNRPAAGGFDDDWDRPRPTPKPRAPAPPASAPQAAPRPPAPRPPEPRPPESPAAAPPRPPPAAPRPPAPAPRPAAPAPRPAAAGAPPAGRQLQPVAPPPRVGAGSAGLPDDDDPDLAEMDLPPSPPAPKGAPAGPVNRSPRAAMSGAQGPNLDDLFGGPQEGRVKIGKRTVPKPAPDGGAEGGS